MDLNSPAPILHAGPYQRYFFSGFAVWGGADYVPRWASEKEMTRFMNLAFQHMADTAERLNEFPEQFEPLFGLREVDGSELTIVEEWCFGYMRGVALSDWSTLPDSLKPGS